jgi:hydroxymethylglutaryl-CoA lyase
MSNQVIINDVGPRDGLQNQPRILSPQQRLQLIHALLAAGLQHVQVAAFVSPSAVPAMAGAAEILAGLAERAQTLSVLVPNMKGYELATAAGARQVEMVVYGSDGMATANVNMSREQADQATSAILARARDEGVAVTVTLSVAFECPFEGRVPPRMAEQAAARFLAEGAAEFIVADTIGAATPDRVRALMEALVAAHGAQQLGCHFHDTRALGLANVFAAIEAGIRRFDASIAGLGGCPFAPGASGNVATEDVVMLLEQMGFDTGVDMAARVGGSARA